jgi:hypothetical protein
MKTQCDVAAHEKCNECFGDMAVTEYSHFFDHNRHINFISALRPEIPAGEESARLDQLFRKLQSRH